MNFETTDDRRMLADTLGRWLRDRYDAETRTKFAYAAPYHDPGRWGELAELGILYALVPEDRGGYGGGGFDLSTVFQALGQAICPEPVLGQAMAARLICRTDEDLDPLMTGAVRYAVAVGELDAPYDRDAVATEAVPDGNGWRLSGRKSVIYGGQAADRFLVVARHGGALALFEVEADAAEVTGYGLIDGGGAAELFLDRTPGRLLLEDAGDAVDEALDAGALALAAEAVGAAERTFEITLDYLKTRKQFGVAIGSFQALQHRMVDVRIEIEQARSIVILAASRFDGPDRARTVSMAKSLVGRTAKLVAEEAIQLHGGIAMTWEYPVSHYAKRLTMLDAQLGDTDWHLERVMAGYDAA